MDKGFLVRLLIAAVVSAASTPAFACREYHFPTKLERPFDNVVLVSVTKAKFSGDQSRFYSWKASARVVRVIAGEADRASYEFFGAWQSTGCERSKPPPAKGEMWVLYLEQELGTLVVARELPLTVAQEIDPRVSAH